MSLPSEVVDLGFQGRPHIIAAFAVRWERGAILVETGPDSTYPNLEAGLARLGLQPESVTDVLLTHIHLDHAGAAWRLALAGARIHVHTRGAPHLIDPSRLLESAGRLYGDQLHALWGDVLPIPAAQVHALQDGDVIQIGDCRFQALDTPGHASHHMAYRFGETCFTGDVGGVRLPGLKHVRLPTPPPEFQPVQWRESVRRLRAEGFKRVAPTHFGPFEDVEWHWDALGRSLDDVEAFMRAELPAGPSLEALRRRVVEWNFQRAVADGLDPDERASYETALPSSTSADGMARYWGKSRG